MVKFGLKAGRTVRSSAVCQGTSPSGLLEGGLAVYVFTVIHYKGWSVHNIHDGVT